MNSTESALFTTTPVQKAVLTLTIPTVISQLVAGCGTVFLSLLRKGCLDIVFMLLLNHTMGISGIAWATPFADLIAFAISLALLISCLVKLNRIG